MYNIYVVIQYMECSLKHYISQNLQDEPEGEKSIKLMISVFFIKGCTQENKC